MHNNLANGVVEDDIILETIQLVSSICGSPKCAEILASNKKYFNKQIFFYRIKNVNDHVQFIDRKRR